MNLSICPRAASRPLTRSINFFFLSTCLASGLIKFVKEGEQAVNNPGLVQLRGFTYSALGQLARRAQHLFLADVSIAELLFESLASEPAEVKVSVQEALSMSCTAYSGVCGGQGLFSSFF